MARRYGFYVRVARTISLIIIIIVIIIIVIIIIVIIIMIIIIFITEFNCTFKNTVNIKVLDKSIVY